MEEEIDTWILAMMTADEAASVEELIDGFVEQQLADNDKGWEYIAVAAA